MLHFNRTGAINKATGSHSCMFIMIVVFCYHSDDSFTVPDRITAVASLTELNQQRRWNLIMV